MAGWNINVVAEEERGNYQALVMDEWRTLLGAPNAELLAAYDSDETPIGALLARIDEHGYEAISLFVKEEYRHQGVATELLDFAEQAALAHGSGVLNAEYAVPEDMENTYLRFFLNRGFLLPKEGSLFYRVPLQELKKSYLLTLPPVSEQEQANIHKLSKLPGAKARSAYRQLERSLPPEMSALAAPGEVLDEYSLAYVSGDKILAYVICCAMGQRIHLHVAHLNGAANGKALINLLELICERGLQETERFTDFSVTIINDASENLLKKLLSGCDILKHRIYYIQKLLAEDLPLPAGWGGVLARSNSLTNALLERGYESSLYMESGMLPYLAVEPQEACPVYIFYDAQDPDYSEFTLTASFQPPTNAALYDEQLEELMMADEGPATLIRSDEDEQEVALVAIQSEEAAFFAETSVDQFLIPFFEQVKRLLAHISQS